MNRLLTLFTNYGLWTMVMFGTNSRKEAEIDKVADCSNRLK